VEKKQKIRLPIIEELKKSLTLSPHLIHVILGPRQVGKTTSIHLFLDEQKKEGRKTFYYSADDVFNPSIEWLREIWQEARTHSALLVIDEIQKIEQWSDFVKGLWDEDQRYKRPLQYVFLGSSSLENQKGLSESLAGRFRLLRAHHWNYQESHLAYGLNFEEYLKFGGYPGSYHLLQGDQKGWNDYVKHSLVEAVIEKDILKFHRVKSPALFKQVFELLTHYPAQVVSYTKLLGALQDRGNTDLIKHYIDLFEGAFLFKKLEKFSTNTLKRKSSSPKILPLCPAFYYLTLLDDFSGIERGRAFEVVVGMQLVRSGLDLFYWREGSDEVDFVVKYGRTLWAIEVKSGRFAKEHKGLKAFQKLFPQALVVVIHPENYQTFEDDPFLFLQSFKSTVE
jgi:uncharacterized protein